MPSVSTAVSPLVQQPSAATLQTGPQQPSPLALQRTAGKHWPFMHELLCCKSVLLSFIMNIISLLCYFGRQSCCLFSSSINWWSDGPCCMWDTDQVVPNRSTAKNQNVYTKHIWERNLWSSSTLYYGVWTMGERAKGPIHLGDYHHCSRETRWEENSYRDQRMVEWIRHKLQTTVDDFYFIV